MVATRPKVGAVGELLPSCLARVKIGTSEANYFSRGVLGQSSIRTRLGHDNKHWEIAQSGISYFSAGALIIDAAPRAGTISQPHMTCQPATNIFAALRF